MVVDLAPDDEGALPIDNDMRSVMQRLDVIDRRLSELEKAVVDARVQVGREIGKAREDCLGAVSESTRSNNEFNRLGVNFFIWSVSLSVAFLGVATILDFTAPGTRYLLALCYAVGGMLLFFPTNRLVRHLWKKMAGT